MILFFVCVLRVAMFLSMLAMLAAVEVVQEVQVAGVGGPGLNPRDDDISELVSLSGALLHANLKKKIAW